MMIEYRTITTLRRDELEPLLSASATEGFRFLERLVAEWESGVLRFDGPGESLLGAYQEDQLIAVGGVSRDPYEPSPGTGRLRHLYVLPAERRRGIGGRLVRELESKAKNRFRRLNLRTDRPEAARFYESRGYRTLGPGGGSTHRRDFSSS